MVLVNTSRAASTVCPKGAMSYIRVTYGVNYFNPMI